MKVESLGYSTRGLAIRKRLTKTYCSVLCFNKINHSGRYLGTRLKGIGLLELAS